MDPLRNGIASLSDILMQFLTDLAEKQRQALDQ